MKFRNSDKKRKKKKNGFTLVEMLVAMGIIAVIMVLFFNVITISIDVIYKSLARNFVREELTELANLISRDIRNADFVIECSNTSADGCEMYTGGKQLRWVKCGDAICKDVSTGEDSFGEPIYGSREYTTSDDLIFSSFQLESASFISSTGNPSQETILVTFIASHSNPGAEVNDNFRQITASTRNYEL